jgi:hypothetical protein
MKVRPKKERNLLEIDFENINALRFAIVLKQIIPIAFMD